MSEVIKEEIINEEDLTPEEEIKIARLTLGSGYDAEITIKEKYIFKVCTPTFMQDLQITINANNLLAGMIKEDLDMKLISNIVCTIRMVVTQIEELTSENGVEKKTVLGKGPDCFWRFIENRHDVDNVYNTFILPLYFEYLKFKETIKTDVEELKNS